MYWVIEFIARCLLSVAVGVVLKRTDKYNCV